MSHVAVIDIGKTNAKVALVHRQSGHELRVLTTPNRVLPGPPWPHFDTDGLWRFIVQGLTALSREARVEGIVTTTHGASGVLLDVNGGLAAPVLDYEHPGPDALRADYDRIRPAFGETGSPPLPLGLNLGAQIHWQFQTLAGLREKVATILTLPQYWGFRLTGQVASDLSSLGCHTDLWSPGAGTWSSLPERLGIAGKLAPPRRPGEVLGQLLPEIQRMTGIGPVPVLVGIHDSNASLLPHLLTRKPPFSVVSTGTWVIVMAIGGRDIAPDPARDMLVNVDAMGRPVPSARFMGGREFSLLTGDRPARPAPGAEAAVRAKGLMVLPAVISECGPFQGRRFSWTAAASDPAEIAVAASWYLALMTAECLALTGAAGPVIIEGPFAANDAYLRMLSAATGRPALPSLGRTGTSAGAALLFGAGPEPAPDPVPAPPDPALAAYASAWRERVSAGGRSGNDGPAGPSADGSGRGT